jgi:hypothetical protein
VFPAREGLPATDFFWYDGNPDNKKVKALRPSPDITKDVLELTGNLPGSGCLLIGDNGQLFSPDDYGAQFFLKLKGDKEFVSSKNHDAAKAVPSTIARNEFQGDTDWRHHQEWIKAIKGGPTPYSNFEIAAYLTEIILLGCVAMRVGKKLDWDGPAMKATNAPEAAKYITRVYRKGFELA